MGFPKLDVACAPALYAGVEVRAQGSPLDFAPSPSLGIPAHSRSTGLAAVTIRSARFHPPSGHPRPLLRVNSSIERAIFGCTRSCLSVPDEIQQDPYHLINVFQTAHS